MSESPLADVLLTASRLIWYAGILGVIGTSTFRLLVVRTARRPTGSLGRVTAVTGVLAAAILLAGTLARLYAQTYVLFGVEEPVTASLLIEVATSLPPWSTGWMWQATAAVVALVAFALTYAGSAVAWGIVHAGVLGVAATVPLTGHAVAQADHYLLPLVLQAVHVLGVGCWIGGLCVLLMAGVPRAGRVAAGRTTPGSARPDSDTPGSATPARLVGAFSPLALVSVTSVVVTGLTTTWLYLGTPADLWRTTYGSALLLKIALFGCVAAAGFVNWRYVRPRLAEPDGAAALWRTGAVELLLAAAVLAVTAVLVGLPQPQH
jgi:putative copper export protein